MNSPIVTNKIMGDNDIHMHQNIVSHINTIKTAHPKLNGRFLFVAPNKRLITKLKNPFRKPSPKFITSIIFAFYVALSIIFHEEFDFGFASLAAIPIIYGSWYFGIRGGTFVWALSVLTNIILSLITKQSATTSVFDPSFFIRIFTGFLIVGVIGRLGTVTREKQDALLKLEEYEKEREAHAKFLELLNRITGMALEAEDLKTTFKILVEKISELFKADDCYFSLWDEDQEALVPTVAYGSMSDIYPFMVFKPDELTLAKSTINIAHPVAVPDTENSPYIDGNIAMLFPNRSMLGLPLIAQNRKLGTLILGYNKGRSFDQDQISRAGITSEQVSLILSKSLLLDDERKQVRQLTALHNVAHISTQVDNEDKLIESITEIIGKNLFLDNFGILLLDEQKQVLRPHTSYRFYSTEEIHPKTVALGKGITGQVALTKQPQCIGNVRQLKQYLDVDDRTISELCVPILFKGQLLGVINVESTKRNAFNADDERLLVTLAGQIATAIEQIRKAQAERKWFDQLAHSNDLIYSVAQITTQIERALTTDEIIQNLGNELRNIGLTCILAIHNPNFDIFTIKYTSLESDFLELVENGLGYPLIEYTFSRSRLEQILHTKNILYPAVVSSPEEEIEILFTGTERDGVRRILKEIGVTPDIEPLRLPLVLEENLQGILWVWGGSIQKSDMPIMSIFAKQVGISLERARLFQEVQELALTDPLTGLNNRRSLFEFGKIEFSRAIRMNRSFCCMMLDLDHFKQINDNYGHLIGDLVLQEFAKRCKNSIREIDLIGRYGGEEVVIFLPETDVETAKHVAERLRKQVAKKPIRTTGCEINLTVSIGIAGKDRNTLDLDTLVARADQAMYIAKHKGRNCVTISV